MKRIGLIAGNLDLPVIWARAAQNEGYKIICTTVTRDARVHRLKEYCERVYTYPKGDIDSLIQTFKEEGITQAVMVGKVPKEMIFRPDSFDERGRSLLSTLSGFSNDQILQAVVKVFQEEGIHIKKQTSFIQSLVPKKGPLTQEPNEDLLLDMAFGFRMAKALGDLDIGQTVVVKDRTVVAVEALEGTDATIRRGGSLVEDGVVAKMAKPNQDMRFDIPIVGLDTLRAMEESKMQALVLEAGHSAILNKERFLERAREQGRIIYAMEDDT